MGMGLKLIVPPATTVISLEEAKRHVEVTHEEDNEKITDYIEAAQSLLEGKDGLLNRCIVPQTWRLSLDDWPESEDGGAFRIPLPPLISVEAIRYVDPDGVEQTLAEEAYRVDTQREPGWVSPVDSWPAVLTTINAVTVEFVAGYQWEESHPTSPYPPKVKQLVREIVASMMENRGNESWSLPDALREKALLLKCYWP